MRAEGRGGRVAWAEAVVVLGIVVFYLASFSLSSAVNGPVEVFAQDSVYILDSLAQGKHYPWNPQSHLLYHYVVESGYDAWVALVGPGRRSAYVYLKLFTALTGLGFLAALRRLLVELRLGAAQRVVLLVFTGVTMSAWFHFAAFETHCVALPALALYLLALARLRDRPARGAADRAMLIGSLAVCGWTRVELVRLTLVSALLPVLPRARRFWRALVADVAIAGVLVVAGTAVLAAAFFERPLGRVAFAALQRNDRGSLENRIRRLDNLSPGNLAVVGRAVTLYSVLMPVTARPAGRSYLAPPSYDVSRIEWPKRGDLPSTGLFLERARNLLGNAVSLPAFAGVATLLVWAGGLSLKRIREGDPFHAALAAQALGAWLLYTWFNPFEPFLWTVEFLPLWIAMIADHSRDRPRAYWVALSLVTLAVAVHNTFAFYLPFS